MGDRLRAVRSQGQQAGEERQQPRLGDRVVHYDYGRGEITAMNPSEIHVQYDKPYLPDSQTYTLVHDRAFLQNLQRLVVRDGQEVPLLPPTETP